MNLGFIACFAVVLGVSVYILANNDLREYAKNCSVNTKECIPKMIEYAIVKRNKLLERKIVPEDKCKKQPIGVISTLGKTISFYNDSEYDKYELEDSEEGEDSEEDSEEPNTMILRKRASVTGSMSTREASDEEKKLPDGTRIPCDMEVQQNHVGWFIINFTVVAKIKYIQESAIGPWFVNGAKIKDIQYDVDDVEIQSNNDSVTGLLESQLDSIKEDEILGYLRKHVNAEEVNKELPSEFFNTAKFRIAFGVFIACLIGTIVFSFV